MSGNQGSDAERGQQKAYEERAAPIQQHIRHLLEEHSRLTVLARQNRPSAQDDVSRLIQLHATLRPLTQRIRNYIVDYLRADTEWSRIIAEFRLDVNRSAWAQSMLQQRNLFYHGQSLASTPLDQLFAQLLQDVQRTLEDIEAFIQAGPDCTVPPYAAASAPQIPQSDSDPAHSVGPSGPPRNILASDAAHSVARTDPSQTRAPTDTSSRPRPPSARPVPANLHHRTDPPHGGTARPTAQQVSTGNARTFVNSSRRRTATAGIMGVTDGNVADAIPLAWNASYDHDFRHGPAQAYATAPPSAHAGHTAHSVGPYAAEPMRTSEQPRPQRPMDTERQRQLQQSLINTVAGGRGPSQATSSNPLQFGADGRPFACSTTDAAPAPYNRAADFGEDFARENSSMFYRNAEFTRRPAQTSTSQPPLSLRDVPLTPFDGNIRSYQEFRNRFLEIVEAQRNLEPRHKLLHLLQHLRGEPLRMSEGFPIADESYFDVIDLLEQKYGNKTVLRNLLMQDVIDLPSPRMTREELQLFHDKAFRTIRNLRQLGPGCGPDSTLVQVLLGKLPHTMKMKLNEGSGLASLDANAILKGVRDHVSDLEMAFSTGITFQQRPQEQPTTQWSNPPGIFNQQNRARTNQRHDYKQAPSNLQFYVADFSTTSCPFCNGGHSANDCTTYATADDRIKRASELNLCLLCLEGDHGRWTCPRRPWTLRLRDLLLGRPAAYHEALNRNALPPSLPVRPTDPFAAGVVDRLPSTAGYGLREPVNFLTNGVPDAISPPIGTVPHAWEQPTVLGVCSAQCEACHGNSSSRTTASPEKTAPGQGSTPRPTTSSEGRSQNPQDATAYGDEESLLTPRQYLSADNDSRTRTTQGAPKDGLGTDASKECIRTPLGGCFLRSNEEVLIHKRSEESTSRVSKPPASTSNRFTDVGYTAPPTPNSLAVLLECVEALASAPNEDSTTRQMRTMRSDDVPAIEGSSGFFRDVTVFFDSGCSDTCVSNSLMERLHLPRHRQRVLHVNRFGTRPPAVTEGIDTTITLWTTDYRPITFDAIALATIAPQVTSALVEKTDLPLLYLGFLPIRPLRLQPDVIIGQDLVHLFDRQVQPNLPHGFYVVKTNIGTTLGGAGQLSAARGDASPSPRGEFLFIRPSPS